MFYVNNLDARQSRQANDSASIAKRAKERFRNSESQRKRSRRPNATIIERVGECKQTLSVCITPGVGS